MGTGKWKNERLVLKYIINIVYLTALNLFMSVERLTLICIKKKQMELTKFFRSKEELWH